MGTIQPNKMKVVSLLVMLGLWVALVSAKKMLFCTLQNQCKKACQKMKADPEILPNNRKTFENCSEWICDRLGGRLFGNHSQEVKGLFKKEYNGREYKQEQYEKRGGVCHSRSACTKDFDCPYGYIKGSESEEEVIFKKVPLYCLDTKSGQWKADCKDCPETGLDGRYRCMWKLSKAAVLPKKDQGLLISSYTAKKGFFSSDETTE